MALAAAWLARATGQAAYVKDADAAWHAQAAGAGAPAARWDWDTQWWAASLLLLQLTGEASYRAQVCAPHATEDVDAVASLYLHAYRREPSLLEVSQPTCKTGPC